MNRRRRHLHILVWRLKHLKMGRAEHREGAMKKSGMPFCLCDWCSWANRMGNRYKAKFERHWRKRHSGTKAAVK